MSDGHQGLGLPFVNSLRHRRRLRRHAMNPMLNLCKGCAFVELNYPHIIGIRGYERHHDVATWSGEIRPNSFKMHAAMPVSDICLPAPIVPNQASV